MLIDRERKMTVPVWYSSISSNILKESHLDFVWKFEEYRPKKACLVYHVGIRNLAYVYTIKMLLCWTHLPTTTPYDPTSIKIFISHYDILFPIELYINIRKFQKKSFFTLIMRFEFKESVSWDDFVVICQVIFFPHFESTSLNFKKISVIILHD